MMITILITIKRKPCFQRDLLLFQDKEKEKKAKVVQNSGWKFLGMAFPRVINYCGL